MSIFGLSLLSAVGILMAFILGLNLGMRYQLEEDKALIKEAYKEAEKTLEETERRYIKMMDATYKNTSEIIGKMASGEIEDIKHGGF